MCKGREAESTGDPGVIEGRDAVSKKEAWYQGQPGVRMHEYCKEFWILFHRQEATKYCKSRE